MPLAPLGAAGTGAGTADAPGRGTVPPIPGRGMLGRGTGGAAAAVAPGFGAFEDEETCPGAGAAGAGLAATAA